MSKTTTKKPDPARSEANASGAKRYRVSTRAVTERTADYPDASRAAARQLHAYAIKGDVGRDELAQLIKKADGSPYSPSAIYNFLTGQQTAGSLKNLTAAVRKFLEIEADREHLNRAPFIETRLAKRVWKICDAARTFQKISFIYGDSQIGKTTALEEYQLRNNHGETTYVRMPAFGTWGVFMRALARPLGLPYTKSASFLHEAVIDTFDRNKLLIIDQAHECFRTHAVTALRPLLWAMELHDAKRCGVVLVGTQEFEDEMQKGRHAKILEQLRLRRSPLNLKLPSRPTKANLNEFSRHFGLPPADGDALDLQTHVIRDERLGQWLTLLQVAAEGASRKSTALRWSHVLDAYADLKRLSQGA